MVKEKLVIDTNVLLSAFGWKGNEHRLLERVVDGEFQLYLSERQLEEISRVLSYEKFSFPSQVKKDFLLFLRSMADIINVPGRLDVIKEDPSDNIILETAIVSGAKIIISGDKHLLNVKECEDVRIMTAKEFLSSLR